MKELIAKLFEALMYVFGNNPDETVVHATEDGNIWLDKDVSLAKDHVRRSGQELHSFKLCEDGTPEIVVAEEPATTDDEDTTEPVEPVEPTEPIAPVEPTEPVEPVEPVEPIEPIAPVEPTEPVVETNPQVKKGK